MPWYIRTTRNDRVIRDEKVGGLVNANYAIRDERRKYDAGKNRWNKTRIGEHNAHTYIWRHAEGQIVIVMTWK